jgi:hypothetical protein
MIWHGPRHSVAYIRVYYTEETILSITIEPAPLMDGLDKTTPSFSLRWAADPKLFLHELVKPVSVTVTPKYGSSHEYENKVVLVQPLPILTRDIEDVFSGAGSVQSIP